MVGIGADLLEEFAYPLQFGLFAGFVVGAEMGV